MHKEIMNKDIQRKTKTKSFKTSNQHTIRFSVSQLM